MHALFDRKLSRLLLLICLPLFFLPKINLMRVGGETAGIRIDDAVLAILAILMLPGIYFSKKPLSKIELCILFLIGFGFISVLISNFGMTLLDQKPGGSLLYVLRPLEYFILFYVGTLIANHFSPQRFINYLFGFFVVLMTLQYKGLVGAMVKSGYITDVSYRVQGNASFPSEMGLMLNLVYCYIAFYLKPPETPSRILIQRALTKIINNPFTLFAIFAFLITITGNRVSILALLLCFMIRLATRDVNDSAAGALGQTQNDDSSNETHKLKKGVNPSTIVLALVLIGLMTIPLFYVKGVSDRSSQLFKTSNFKIIPKVWDRINIHQTPNAQGDDAEECDGSWWIRIHKWCYASKLFYYNPWAWPTGMGPGFLGPAMDGGFLRILVEYGALGSIIYLTIFIEIAKISRRMKWVVFAFLINMVFFDTHLAYKVMGLLYLFAGIDFQQSRAKESLTNEQLIHQES